MNYKNRNSTIESLRIISVFMILGLHYLNVNIGGGLLTTNVINSIIGHLIESFCIISINCLVLITGYFSFDRDKIQFMKLIDLYCVLIFYNLLFYIVSLIMCHNSFSLKELFFDVFPFLRGGDWFVETYIILMFFAPFINKLLRGISKNQFRLLLIIQLSFFSLWPSFLPSAPITDRGYGIINFVTVYMIGAYIKKYISNDQEERKTIFLGATALSVFIICVSSYMPFLSSRAWIYCYIFNIVASVCFFISFLICQPFNNAIVNKISSCSFGIIIFHATPYLQDLVYDRMMRIKDFNDSRWYIIHFIVCLFVQFLICLVIELCRQFIWKGTMKKIIYSKYNKKFENKINEIVS